jgi:hypothetical protein
MRLLEKFIKKHSKPIQKCFFEYFSKNENQNVSLPSSKKIFLKNDRFLFRNFTGTCLFHITEKDVLIIVFIDDLDFLNNPPPNTYLFKFLNFFKQVDFKEGISDNILLFKKNVFLSNLKAISVFGPVIVYICCDYGNDFFLTFEKNAMGALNFNIPPETVNLILTRKSGVIINGLIKSLNIVRLEPDCCVDLRRSNFDETNGYSFSIPISEPIGGILINTQMQTIYEIFLSEAITSSFFEPVETKRQQTVRKKIKVPVESSAMIEVDAKNESEACGTCCSYVANAIFDCGHVYMCLECTEKMRVQKYSNFLCPLCKKEINTVGIVESFKKMDSSTEQTGPFCSSPFFSSFCPSHSSSSSSPSSSSSSFPSLFSSSSTTPLPSSSTSSFIDTKSCLDSSKKIKRQRLD